MNSAFAVTFLMVLLGLGICPYMLPSNPMPEMGLTIYNAASSQKTLGIMFLIALPGVPLVLPIASVSIGSSGARSGWKPKDTNR